MAAKKVSERTSSSAAKVPTLAQLIARTPSIGADERAAFTAQYSKAECIALGARTKSAAVRECAVQWAALALKGLSSSDGELIAYSLERLSFVLELVVTLDAERASNSKTDVASGSLRSGRDLARTRLGETRIKFFRVLVRATKGDDQKTADVERLRAHGESDRETAEAVRDAAALGEKLLKGGKAQRIVASSVGLTDALVKQAKEASAALLGARDDVAIGASGTHQRDSTDVNAIEGRVLHEMRLMKGAFDDARADGASVPVLMPTLGVASVFKKTSSKKSDPKPAA
jgi:hypothetical protein